MRARSVQFYFPYYVGDMNHEFVENSKLLPGKNMKPEKVNGTTTIQLPKNVTYPSANTLAISFQNLFERGEFCIVMDASKLMGIDSYGMGILMKQWIKARELGGGVRIRFLAGEAEKRFKEARIFDLFSDEDV